MVGNPAVQALGTIEPAGSQGVLLVNSGGPGRAPLSGLKPNAEVEILTRDRSGLKRGKGKTSSTGSIMVPLPLRCVVTLLVR